MGSPGTLEEIMACRGDYEKTYDTLKSIGKGAFGFVKLARKRSDKQMVVVKFIRKARVLEECWIDVPKKGIIPLEIHFLRTLSHPNIVKVLDVFENEEFYQVVMEKHGDGIDLFEFIDRRPALDEPLESYMFRQVVEAVSYLHSLNITHRDIKDENIIIDRQFMCKLIDFGSAAIMEKGKLFGTFCGTIEYCSPEVLLGNRYRGPELECWSLGVTLYTLVFGENPYFDIEESIQARFQPPFAVSAALTHLLMWILHPEPRARATIQDMQTHRWLCQPVDLNRYKWETVVPSSITGQGTMSQTESVMDVNAAPEQRQLDECVLGEALEGMTPIDSDEDQMEGQYKRCLEDDDQSTTKPNQSKGTDSI
jgi:PAS domain-containing serine/threonine kinase